MKIKTSKLQGGAGYFIAGIHLVFHPSLRRYIVIPLLINTLLFSVASWVLWHYLMTTVDAMLPSWLDWLAWLILPVFIISLLSVVYYGFTIVANIIAAPFYGLLAKAVEAHLKGETPATASNSSMIKEAISITLSELRKLWYYLVRATPLLLLSFVPGINVFSLPVWLLFSAWFLSFEYAGYAFENHAILFEQQKQVLRRSRWTSLSFGGCSLLATMVPVVNFLVPAISVAGATKMLIDRGDV
ncbi:MAG: sulfate transporter CysZ [Cycloclasticus sp.]|nr:sulfate transporter CysZ [Cycloclasticus sp.]